MKQDEEESQQGYQTSKVPWFVVLIWLTFIIWAVWYTISYFVPDIRNWLK